MKYRLVKNVPNGTVGELLQDLRPGGQVCVWVKLTQTDGQWFDFAVNVGKGDFILTLKRSPLSAPVVPYYVMEPLPENESRYATRIVYIGRGPDETTLKS